MIKFYTLIVLLSVLSIASFAQKRRSDTANRDTTHILHSVVVRGYLSQQPALSVPASVSVLTPEQIKLQPENSLVSTMNTVPGVRMEERTPGSYRLSIRGSLLRSPFGVRDVKVYMDDIPLTDAGGNTYLNAIDFNSVKGIEVLKGPDGSLFGANSGGVVIISPVNRYADSNSVQVGLNAGSYGLVHEQAGLQHSFNNNQLNINQAYQSYDGYRDHSYMQRHYIQAVDRWRASAKDELRAYAFYSDLSYQTPGGLTLAQFNANPQAARPATVTLPSAIQQQIGISTKVLFGGLVNEAQLTPQLRNVLAVFGNHVDFSNPFITNYEQRNENTYGLRTYFEWSAVPHKNFNWKVNVGLEWQQTNSQINNYGNKAGVKDTTQTADQIHTNQHFVFVRYVADIVKRLHIEAAASLNWYGYDFKNVYPLAQTAFARRSFTPQLMPRLALSYQITGNFIWRASVSRGYSTPTTAEVRPTDNVINTALNAQDGVNYETGFRIRDNYQLFMLDASVFYYKLRNAIVRRLHPDETEYYINAGGTKQPGFELYGTAWLIKQNNTSFIRGLQLNESLTLSKFTFDNYNVSGNNYSGNKLTGVPGQVSVTGLQILFPQQLSLYTQYNYTSSLPLNDANSVFARRYHLVQAKASWMCMLSRNTRLEIYAGADNLLNQKYSLGNDLNAVGNRYYNAAPLRNFYAGFNVIL
ncbi:TonB-dependent receptor [Mucilaginibacter sp. KACC 22063]|uniref:TonB-dependent receptor n=1 Tax=Mucilaginibacter sp. KACC 22063 TaxID=3025666 RepID=UPI00236570FD|nr:TonB-dependent receptor [Mucilaginibacter sp. KACC 22063]WDF56179.1 TonB-dependent receptor [Mucilaginibacter sp. KACC 22063]